MEKRGPGRLGLGHVTCGSWKQMWGSGAATWLPPDLWAPEQRSKVEDAAVVMLPLCCRRRGVGGRAGRRQGGGRLLMRVLPRCRLLGPQKGEAAAGSVFLATRWCRGGQ